MLNELSKDNKLAVVALMALAFAWGILISLSQDKDTVND